MENFQTSWTEKVEIKWKLVTRGIFLFAIKSNWEQCSMLWHAELLFRGISKKKVSRQYSQKLQKKMKNPTPEKRLGKIQHLPIPPYRLEHRAALQKRSWATQVAHKLNMGQQCVLVVTAFLGALWAVLARI